MFKQTGLSALIGLLFATSLHAEEAFRQHEAHVHGSVEMNIAQDGHDLLIEITAPGMDVVGFEHAPETEQQHQQIEQIAKQLENARQMLTINPQADCHLESAAVHHPALEDEHQDEHAGHDHDSHSHEAHQDEQHDHADHDEHAHEHEHEHEHGNHSEFSIEYSYHCEQVDQLQSLKTNWFKQFPQTHSIEANVFTDKQQTSTELTAQQTEIRL